MQNNRVNSNKFFITLFVISLLAEGVFIDLGFALKLYMILTPIVLLYVLKKGFVQFFSFERLYVIFSFYFILGSFLTTNPLNSLRYSIVIFFSVLCVALFKNYLIKKNNFIDIERMFINAFFWFSSLSLLLYIIGIVSLGFNFYSAGGENINVYGVMLDRSTPRLIGIGQDPNNFVFGTTLPWYFLAFKKEKSRFEKLTFFLMTSCVLLTFSRGGWLGIFVPYLFYYLFNLHKINFKYLISLVLSSIAIVFYNFDRLYFLLDEGIENRLNIGSGSGRFDLWSHAMNVFNDNIFFGLGADMYRDIYGKYVHNTYIQVLVDGGVVGFSLFFIFLVMLFKEINLIHKLSKRNNIFLVLCFCSLLIQMFSLSILYNESWILILGFIGFKSYYFKSKNYVK